MRGWTSESRQIIADVARRNDFDESAGLAMADALAASGGGMAQFHHPALGGMGQWSNGGMLMIGDMFNDALKFRVRRLAEELAGELSRGGLAYEPSAPGTSSGGFSSFGQWWPAALGSPSSTGAQNDRRYAVFPDSRRLAVELNGVVSVYDTADYSIGGASQQQGGGSTLSFSTNRGQISLFDLAKVDDDGSAEGEAKSQTSSSSPGPQEQASPERSVAQRPDAVHTSEPAERRPTEDVSAPASAPSTAGRGDPLELLVKLADLKAKGVLTEDEFAAKKAELLARI